MNPKKLSEKKWYNGAVIACIGVAFYVLLTNLGPVGTAISRFIGYFQAVILGAVFAYIVNPLAKFLYEKPLRKLKKENTRWALSVIMAFLLALLVLFLLIAMIVPQFVQSIVLFSENFDGYAYTLITWLQSSAVAGYIDADSLSSISQNALSSISVFVRDNAGNILGAAANSGKSILSTGVALILSVYLLMDKKSVLSGASHLAGLIFRPKTIAGMRTFCFRCDRILVSYLIQTLFDSLIVGTVNALFMLICGMQYVGLVSVVVGITNLIPNFGPLIGGVIGGFVLLLVNPWHALIFIAFCVVLQFGDAYLLKPKLFSNSLGVSGLLILVASIVLGNMFGIIGILLAIPAAAVMSFVYKDYFVPMQEKRFLSQE